MRLALVHPFVWPEVRRGGERYLDDIATEMLRRGHTVDIITGSSRSAAEDRRDDGLVVRRVRLIRPAPLRRYGVDAIETFGLSIIPTLLRHRYDVVHALVPAAALAARLARLPTLYSVIGHPAPATASGSRPLKRAILGRAVTRATMTAALSRASADEVEALTGRATQVVGPGVRLERFPVARGARSGPVRLLFASSADDRRKGLDVLLAAFARLLERHADARLRLAGPGDHRWALAGLGPDRPTVEAGLDVLGAGRTADVPVRYREATVTVLPSRDEAFGLVLVESLASGTPVVCSRSGGMPEIVTDPRIGRIAPPGDARALALAIEEAIALSRDPGTPDRCATHASNWSWAGRVGDRHEEVYGLVSHGPTI